MLTGCILYTEVGESSAANSSSLTVLFPHESVINSVGLTCPLDTRTKTQDFYGTPIISKMIQ